MAVTGGRVVVRVRVSVLVLVTGGEDVVTVVTDVRGPTVAVIVVVVVAVLTDLVVAVEVVTWPRSARAREANMRVRMTKTPSNPLLVFTVHQSLGDTRCTTSINSFVRTTKGAVPLAGDFSSRFTTGDG